MNLQEFWTDAHKRQDVRWVSHSDPRDVLKRLGVNLDGVKSVLEIGPGTGTLLANYLNSLGKRVVLHDIVRLDDPRYIRVLPLRKLVDAAIAHLVFQHVPPEEQRTLMTGVMGSLVSGGRFYFDAVSEDCSENPALAEEYEKGTSFPFAAWDFVDESREHSPGYFFCVAQA